MNHAVVGAFVLLLGAVLVAAVLWLASGGALKKKYDLYLAIEEESVSGLSLDAPVKYRGVEVGKVRDIQLDPANPQHVRLLFAIERGTPINKDTLAVLKTQGLTGIAYVELGGGNASSPPLLASAGEPYPVIHTKPSLSARLENVLTGVLEKLDRTSSNIDTLLSTENQAALKSALADIAAVSRTVAARKAEIDAALVGAARTLDNSARATARLTPLIERAGPLLERVGRGADAVEKAGNEVALAGASAAKTVGAVGGDVQRFSAETLPQVQQLLGEMNDLSLSLRRLSEQTARDPASLLRGSSPVADGPGEAASESRQR